MDLSYDVMGRYIPFFVEHLKDTRTRLGLRIGSQPDDDQSDAGDAAAEAAEAHGFSSWTPSERDALFRAISVHSRWRPDLIAACVPTKTEWEIWMYLEALEEGAATLAAEQGGDDVDMEDDLVDDHPNEAMQVDSDGRSQSSGSVEEDEDEDTDESTDADTDTDKDKGEDKGEDQELCEPALEVSQDWIDAEERMAARIIDEEHLAFVEIVADADTEKVGERAPARKRGRPRGGRKGRTQRQGCGQTVSKTGLRSPSPEPKSQSAYPDPSIGSARKREVMMARLEVPHLQVLESILREDETAMKEKSKSREGSVTTPLPEHGGERVLGTRESSLLDRITRPSGTSNDPESSSNAVIDPVLLALSGAADPTGHQSGQVGSERATASCAPAPVPAQGSSLLLNVSSQPASLEVSSQAETSNVTSPQDNIAATNPDPTTNAESDLSLFSPRSRRRIQKRLYMRRKRALLRGNGVASEVAIDAGIEKLKPGKKTKSEQREISVVSTSIPCSEATSDAEAELPENVPKKNKPGLTLAYKLKAQCTELGIDAAYIRGQGMGLLNLGALGKLMGLYASLEHDGEEADETTIAACIDAQLIQHLQAAMVSFVTDLIHRAIVWRERETRLKQRSRVWRQGDQITVGAVEHAVETIGARHRSHKAYLKSLEAFHGQAAEVPNSSPVDADVGPAVLSPHREVHTPLIHPPSAWKMRPLTCLSRTYEREATRTRRGPSADIGEDELMADETDEEALEAELALEAETDERDMALSAMHEEDLWRK